MRGREHEASHFRGQSARPRINLIGLNRERQGASMGIDARATRRCLAVEGGCVCFCGARLYRRAASAGVVERYDRSAGGDKATRCAPDHPMRHGLRRITGGAFVTHDVSIERLGAPLLATPQRSPSCSRTQDRSAASRCQWRSPRRLLVRPAAYGRLGLRFGGEQVRSRIFDAACFGALERAQRLSAARTRTTLVRMRTVFAADSNVLRD